jgi:hypothetical protein
MFKLTAILLAIATSAVVSVSATEINKVWPAHSERSIAAGERRSHDLSNGERIRRCVAQSSNFEQVPTDIFSGMPIAAPRRIYNPSTVHGKSSWRHI